MIVWSYLQEMWVEMPAEWTEPHAVGRENPGAHITRLNVGAAHVGSVFFHPGGGSYYALTQIRRLGAYSTMSIAKEIVEYQSLRDLYEYPTAGTA